MEWTIQQLARAAGTTSRTLRHYGDIGLLRPSRIGANGYRHYDEDGLVRLQRILLLRELGLGLPQIAGVLERPQSEEAALTAHLEALRADRERLERRITAVERTVARRRKGQPLMADEMFDGFDHSRYREEVARRWGQTAAARSEAWWRGLESEEKKSWAQRTTQLGRDWVAVAESGAKPSSAAAQAVAARHVAWLSGVPGTPAADPDGDLKGYLLGLAEMYPADPRFAATYETSAGGRAGAEFVRDALRVYAERQL